MRSRLTQGTFRSKQENKPESIDVYNSFGIPLALNSYFSRSFALGPLHHPVTWYKIKYTGEQVAHWDFQNNAIRTSPPGPVFVLEVPQHNLLTSICNFVPCDRIVQKACSLSFRQLGTNELHVILRTDIPLSTNVEGK